jgi:hypothetical protein
MFPADAFRGAGESGETEKPQRMRSGKGKRREKLRQKTRRKAAMRA